MIYLDHNATTPIAPEVLDAMLPWLREGFGNPSSGHPLGQQARRAVDQARAQVAALIGARPEEIVFTSGGTEANNLALVGTAHAVDGFVTTTIEHPATARPLAALEARGSSVARVPVDSRGITDADAVLAAAGPDRRTISVMLANNETGALQPIRHIGRARGAHLLHTDAAQAIGKLRVKVDNLQCDLLSIAGHKLYAPKGVGALYVREGTPLEPVLRGAGHERGLRPGTENVASIVGLGAACALAEHHLDRTMPHVRERTRRLHALLAEGIPGLRLHGPHEDRRLANTLNVGFPGVLGSAVLAGAPEIAASTGSACHDHGEEPSAVLTAMGLPAHEALGAVRLTLGLSTTDEEVERAAAALIGSWTQLRESA